MPRKKDDKPWSSENPDARIPARVRRRLHDKQNGLCGICKLPLTNGRRAHHIDHIKRLEDGGSHAEHNLQVVHQHCHQVKTAGENSAQAKAARIRTKHLGLKEPSDLAKRYASVKEKYDFDWRTRRWVPKANIPGER